MEDDSNLNDKFLDDGSFSILPNKKQFKESSENPKEINILDKKDFINKKDISEEEKRKEDENSNEEDYHSKNDAKKYGIYKQNKAKKLDPNRKKELKKILSENNEIISEIKNAYSGFTRLELLEFAAIFQNIISSKYQTIFEIMNQIHRDISIQITLNEADNINNKEYLFPIDPYEIIDPLYINPEHIKIMKYFHVYNKDDKVKLPPYIQKILTNDFLYTKESDKRRKIIKYPDGTYNYIPLKCKINNCNNINCPYSHNEYEIDYHPLLYKTKYSNIDKGIYSKTSDDLLKDFRIIYNYKNEKIINLLKLLYKKIPNLSIEDFYKDEINSFELETFKTVKCPHIKKHKNCPKKDPHLCYYYHDIEERRRPPTLFRYTNEMCPKSYKNEKIKCENGVFCNFCHSRYELLYHKLLYGKAMTCLRKKENGKCIYEETCYAYHPYKEPGYQEKREELIQEENDELSDKYIEGNKLLNGLISHYKCQNCNKFNDKFKYVLLANCEHIICNKCFEEKALEKNKCPIPNFKRKFNIENKEEYIEMDIKESAKKIEELIKKNHVEKLVKEEEGRNKIINKENDKKNDEDNEDNNSDKGNNKDSNNEKSNDDDDDEKDNNKDNNNEKSEDDDD